MVPHYVWEECLDALERTPRSLQRLVHLIPGERWRQRPSEELYSPLELVYHLAEVEEAFYERYRLLLEQERPQLRVYDVHASEALPAHLDLVEGVARFSQRRQRSVHLLRTLSPTAWERTGIHPEFGEWSIFQQVQLCVAHDLLHLGDILARSAEPL